MDFQPQQQQVAKRKTWIRLFLGKDGTNSGH